MGRRLKPADQKRLQIVIGVHLILRKGNKVLLARRAGTGYADGCYNFPCGHLDPGEDVIAGLVREAREEIGVATKAADLSFCGATHWRSNKQSVNLFFECRKWRGTPVNGEPDKCDDVSWFDLAKPPAKLVRQTKAVLTALKKKEDGFFIELKD